MTAPASDITRRGYFVIDFLFDASRNACHQAYFTGEYSADLKSMNVVSGYVNIVWTLFAEPRR